MFKNMENKWHNNQKRFHAVVGHIKKVIFVVKFSTDNHWITLKKLLIELLVCFKKFP